jgi:hypothetical protein
MDIHIEQFMNRIEKVRDDHVMKPRDRICSSVSSNLGNGNGQVLCDRIGRRPPGNDLQSWYLVRSLESLSTEFNGRPRRLGFLE